MLNLKQLSVPLFVILACVTGLRAQSVDYQREVAFSGTVQPVLPTTYSPLSPAGVSDPGSHWLISAGPANGLYSAFSSTGATAVPGNFPDAIKVDSSTRTAITGFGTGTSILYFHTALGQLVTFNINTRTILPPSFVDSIVDSTSLAASSSAQVVLIGRDINLTHGGFVIDTVTGEATKVFSTEGDSFLSDTTYYQSYGADGMLYLLDYGNSRMAVLDPSDGFSLSRSFAISGDLANMQFAVSYDGNVFLGDGEGGGSMYSALGALVTTFALPSGSYTNPFTNGIAPYVDYTPDGHVFVFDTTGAHQYVVNAVPEPAAALLIASALGLIGWRRRRRTQGVARVLVLSRRSAPAGLSRSGPATRPE